MESDIMRLDDRFKALWEPDSPMQQEWANFATLAGTIRDLSRDLGSQAASTRHLPDIEAAMKTDSEEMGQLFLETLDHLWNRLLLRTSLKVSDALEVMFFSMNTANAYGCAIAARGVIEHAALLQYFADNIPWRESRAVKHAEMIEFVKRLFAVVQGSTFDWDKLLSGQIPLRELIASGEWKRPRAQGIPQIRTLVEALDKAIAKNRTSTPEGHLHFLYAAISDVLHPSWGSDFIYAPQMYRHFRPDRAFDEHFKRIATLFCLPIFGVVHHLGMLIAFMKGNEPRMLAVLDNG